jgi:hypothetical protein
MTGSSKVIAFQKSCLDDSWQRLTLPKLRYKLFMIEGLAEKILASVVKLSPLEA